MIDPPSVRTRSLAIQVARNMVLWACISTLVITAVGYLFVFQRVEQRTLAYLNGYLGERLRAESQVFRSSEANMEKFEQRFLALYQDPNVLPKPDFEALFEPRPDGTMRLKEDYFNGMIDSNGVSRRDVSGFISPKHPPLTAEFKRRMALLYHVVSELGPAWLGEYPNLYAWTPESAGVIYWPGVPWGLRSQADQADHGARPGWSNSYFDAVAKRWNVSYTRPIRVHGRTILYPGHDILLDDLMQRLIADHPAGAYNLIIGRDGDLIAHPKRIDDLKHSTKGPKIQTLGDPELLSIYRSVEDDARRRTHAGGVSVVENRKVDAYISYGEIKGPGWWFVTVYPRSLVLESAGEAANGLVVLGIVSFAIMTLIVIWVLRERVGRPISQMKIASETVRRGDYQSVADGLVRLPEEEDNEIGLFAQSFRSMAATVGETHRHLEKIVLERTRALQLANQELEKLSFRDSLTGTFNRRCFDRDIADWVRSAVKVKQPAFLLLCDVDYFKLYNDTYGHVAGDRVLRLVADEMVRRARGSRVYRYGGEELALLISHPERSKCRAIAARVVKAIALLSVPHQKSPYGIVTVSAGLAEIDQRVKGVSEIVAAADAFLYRAKMLGRNRLIDAGASEGGSK